MNNLSKNRYLDALLKTILFFAISHLIILTIYAIFSKRFNVLDFFDLLDLRLFFADKLPQGLRWLFTIILNLTVYLTAFFLFTEKKKR